MLTLKYSFVMDETFTNLILSIHYFLNDDQRHQMDALVLNRCQFQLYTAIKHIAELTGEDITMEACALQPGGVIDKLQILFRKDTLWGVTLGFLLQGAVNYFFNKEANTLNNIDKRVEILGKIEKENLTEEEAMILVESDETLQKCISAFYQHLQKEHSVMAISSSFHSIGDNDQPIVSKIERADFDRKIVPIGKVKSLHTFTGTTIAVISPVFAHDTKLKWRCRFNGEQIVAAIKDNDFINQVNNYEIKFDAGTTLKCDLVVETVTDLNRPEKKPILHYYITNVWEWADGEHVVTKTQRFKALNNVNG